MPKRKLTPKSANKSATPGVPFEPGYDPRRGRGPDAGAPNAGRPPERWRKACRDALEDADGLGFVKRVITGEEREIVGVDKNGNAVVSAPRVRDRLFAVELLAEHGHGKPPQEIKVEDEVPRRTGEQTMARILELLPRVLAVLPVDRKEIARLLEQRRAVELLVSGQQVKDGQGRELRQEPPA